MAKDPGPPRKPPPERPAAPASKAEREARLAAALRANLRRRKAQARARQAPPTGPDEPEG
jgi:hypothetical protein